MINEETTKEVSGDVIDAPTELTVVEAMNRAEIDMQISTAKRYPRSIKKFRLEAKDMACLDEEIASSCMYALPRGGKSIEGPSARLAEICLSAWGNCAGAARIIEEGDRFVTAQGVFKDYERNTTVTFEVRRRITNRNGQRFNDDMIGVTSNAACSIAFRNAVFKGIPKAFWQSIYDEARKTAIGDASTIVNRRAQMFEYFQKMGVQTEQILALLEKHGIEDIGGEDLLKLKGLATAIKEGDISVDNAFSTDLASAPTGRITTKPAEKSKPPVAEDWGGKEPEGGEQTKPTDPKPEAKSDAKTEETKTSDPPKEETSAVTEPAQETKDAIPTSAEGRHQWLARVAMTSAGWDDEPMAMTVTRRWMLLNSIGPSQLNKDGVFNPAREQVAKIDWKPAFDEWADAAKAAAEAKDDKK